jgi:hypothetical protein
MARSQGAETATAAEAEAAVTQGGREPWPRDTVLYSVAL